jgi:hypothetical protein
VVVLTTPYYLQFKQSTAELRPLDQIHALLLEGDDMLRLGEYDGAFSRYENARRRLASLRSFYVDTPRAADLKAMAVVVDNRVLLLAAAKNLRAL